MDAKGVYTSDAEDGGQTGTPEGAAVPLHVLCYYTTGICIYFFFFCVF